MGNLHPNFGSPVSTNMETWFGDSGLPRSGGTITFEDEAGKITFVRSEYVAGRLDIGRTALNISKAFDLGREPTDPELIQLARKGAGYRG